LFHRQRRPAASCLSAVAARTINALTRQSAGFFMEFTANAKEIAMPASEPIDEGLFLETNGVEQWVSIRGRPRTNPVLLLVSGPGVALSRMAPFFAPWERDFTLVQWDQPGAGATHSRNGEAGTGPLSIDRISGDGIAVAQLVCERLDVKTVVLLSISAGSIVGLKMVKQRPDLFSAYVGTGQVVNWARQEALSHAMVMAQARAAGDHRAIAELTEIGPPPYKDLATEAIKSKYAGALTPAEQAVFSGLDPAVTVAMRTPPAGARHVPEGLPLLDQRTLSMAAYGQLRDQIAAFDARTLGLTFEVPMLFFQGDRDAYTVTSEVEAYKDEIQSPKKMLVSIEGGGHSTVFMRDDFLNLLNRFVRPIAVAAADGAPSS
jgi:pimeloyl-ACP methyl ester carboxylesterase